MPMVPNISFNVIDVRDVARAHISAMTVPEAAGNRHILASSNVWFYDFAKVTWHIFHHGNKPQED